MLVRERVLYAGRSCVPIASVLQIEMPRIISAARTNAFAAAARWSWFSNLPSRKRRSGSEAIPDAIDRSYAIVGVVAVRDCQPGTRAARILIRDPPCTLRDLGGPPLQGSEMRGPIFWEKRPTCPESPKLGKKTPLYAVDETLTVLLYVTD